MGTIARAIAYLLLAALLALAGWNAAVTVLPAYTSLYHANQATG